MVREGGDHKSLETRPAGRQAQRPVVGDCGGGRQPVCGIAWSSKNPRVGRDKSVRLADLLPPIEVVSGCAYRCEPKKPAGLCARCAPEGGRAVRKLPAESRPVAVVASWTK